MSLLKNFSPFALTALWGRIEPTGFQIAKHALGKYIIGFACLLHVMWAALVLLDRRAGNATPLSIIFAACQNNSAMVVFVLILVAALAGCFLDMRMRRRFNVGMLAMMLIPQQIVLCMSAGAGIYAAIVQHYADNVARSWPHILTDQLPVILMAALYTIALIESRNPPEIQLPPIRRGEKGEKGEKGDKGDKGDAA